VGTEAARKIRVLSESFSADDLHQSVLSMNASVGWDAVGQMNLLQAIIGIWSLKRSRIHLDNYERFLATGHRGI